MRYRRLGRTGLKVSVFSLGTWLTFAEQADPAAAEAVLREAWTAGINLFDTAETYGNGRAELLLGETIARLGWPRTDYLLSTKVHGGLSDRINRHTTLNRKYLFDAIDGCLERLGTNFVEIVYCHRHDPDTPVEDVVWTMSDIIASGRSLYWGTSEWPPEHIREALDIADRRNLRPPVVEQCEYNLLAHERFDRDYRPLATETGLGLCTWSPLASGLLTGKYRAGSGSDRGRADLTGMDWLRRKLRDPTQTMRAARLAPFARREGCSPAQLAAAWCAADPLVASVTLGARSAAQLRHNLGALALLDRLDATGRQDLVRAIAE